jgi:hypothetical protein
MFLHGKWPIYVHMYIWFTYQTLICSLAMAIFRNWRWVLWFQRRDVSAPLFFKGATAGSYTGPCTLFLKCQAETFSPWRALTFTDSCCRAFSGGRTIEKLWNIQTPQFFLSLNEVILLVPVFCWGDYRDYHDPSWELLSTSRMDGHFSPALRVALGESPRRTLIVGSCKKWWDFDFFSQWGWVSKNWILVNAGR